MLPTPIEEPDPDQPIRGQMRVVGYRRVSHGLFLREREGLSEQDEHRRDLRAHLAVLPDGAVFTHVTGARLRGWRLPRLPEQVPVFAAVGGDPPRPRRPGLICSRLRRTTPRVEHRHGLPVDASEEILLRAARDLGLIDVSIMLESALHLGDIDQEAMERVLASQRPGTRLLRAAWQRASGKSQSAGETVLRLFHDAIDVQVVPQAKLYDDRGNLIGVGDLLVVGAGFVHEYDGEVHRDKLQHRTDLRRERGWTGSPYVRRGFTLDDLLNHPAVTMHEIDRALGRPHDLRRVERWRRLVDSSLYSETGRQRVMNRWRRAMGIVEWSRTA
jgi:hypothetical protein